MNNQSRNALSRDANLAMYGLHTYIPPIDLIPTLKHTLVTSSRTVVPYWPLEYTDIHTYPSDHSMCVLCLRKNVSLGAVHLLEIKFPSSLMVSPTRTDWESSSVRKGERQGGFYGPSPNLMLNKRSFCGCAFVANSCR